MIEYKTRRRNSNAKCGDRVWQEGKVEGKPLAIGKNGYIARIDWEEKEAMVLWDENLGMTSYDLEVLRDCWSDSLGGIYIMEEPYVEKNNTITLNGRDS
jgi:hypothetical protein